MDNEELTNMLLECIEKLKDDTFEVEFVIIAIVIMIIMI